MDYQETYTSIYSVAIRKGRDSTGDFTLLPDDFMSEYLENKGIINFRQWGLYQHLAVLSNSGYEFSLKRFARLIGIAPSTLISHLDHFEDCMLLHRVKRGDLQGIPTELVVHNSFSSKELEKEGKLELILSRIASETTKSRRRKSDRSHGQYFSFSYKEIQKSFGKYSRQFANFSLAFFAENWTLFNSDITNFQAEYESRLTQQYYKWRITTDDNRQECLRAANEFRSIYCPSRAELS